MIVNASALYQKKLISRVASQPAGASKKPARKSFTGQRKYKTRTTASYNDFEIDFAYFIDASNAATAHTLYATVSHSL
jgi:hypothetical protein